MFISKLRTWSSQLRACLRVLRLELGLGEGLGQRIRKSMGGFTKMTLIGESMQVRAHSCCISFFLFVTNFSPDSKQSNSEVVLQQHFHQLFVSFVSGGFPALTPRAQIPKNHSLLQTKRRRRFTPGVQQHCCLWVGSGCREPRVSTSAP